MKSPLVMENFENKQALSSRNTKRISLENKWVALTKKAADVIASARTYKALERKLKKDQKEQVVLLKVPKYDQYIL